MKFFFDHRWRIEEEWGESQSECQVTECVSVQRSSLKTVRIYFYRLFLFLLISVRAAVTYKYLTANSTESVLYFYCVELKAHYQNKILRSYKSDIFHLIKVDFKKLEFLFFLFVFPSALLLNHITLCWLLPFCILFHVFAAWWCAMFENFSFLFVFFVLLLIVTDDEMLYLSRFFFLNSFGCDVTFLQRSREEDVWVL